MNRQRVLPLLAGIALGVVLGALLFSRGGGPGGDAALESSSDVWTCSMHPQIRLPEAGQCPICFMDLIPVTSSADDRSAPRLEMSEAARALAEIEVAPVARERASVEVRLTGKIDYDETRSAAITARFPGRLDRLFVDYTGIRVREGDHLVEIYSPELLSAEEELLQAIRAQEATSGSRADHLRTSSAATVEAAREKLRLLGLTAAQVEAIERSRRASDHFTIYARASGVVVEKNAVEGDYVETGTVIYRIADLSSLWVVLDAYESDLAWLRYGQEIEFVAEAIPGEVFRGKVSFVSPSLDPGTRTAKVRVNVENERGILKPEMFVRATVFAEVDEQGHVLAESLEGKWICPMHPEIVRDRADACDLCGMDLARAEEIVPDAGAADGAVPLVVPRSAVLFTGKRAIVYVRVPAERPTYEGREVLLGPRAGDVYVVRSGLREGDEVVVQGGFKIDSALQIEARPSMMSADPTAEAAAPPGAGPSGTASPSLTAVSGAYLQLSKALAADDLPGAQEAVSGVRRSLSETTGAADEGWGDRRDEMAAALEGLGGSSSLGEIRDRFDGLSRALIAVVGEVGSGGTPLYVAHCPMAFDDRGADWLQDDEQVANPYFGASMLRCGVVKREVPR